MFQQQSTMNHNIIDKTEMINVIALIYKRVIEFTNSINLTLRVNYTLVF